MTIFPYLQIKRNDGKRRVQPSSHKRSYYHLLLKADGRIITKTRYVIPIENGLFVELDIFEGDLAPLVLAEIEFPDEAFAKAYQAPSWLKEDVTYSSEYHNSTLSKKD